MPNWVYNSVSIEGSSEKVRSLRDLLAQPHRGVDDGPFNYYNLAAPPEDRWEEYNSEQNRSLTDPYNWYCWRIKHWGVKWNASETTWDEQELPLNRLVLNYHFDSPWGPPEGIMHLLDEHCKENGLTLEWHWEEEQGFGELWQTDEGRFQMVDAWSIPNSHKDHVDRDKECVCAWEGDNSYWYSDCPGAKIESNKEEVNGEVQPS